MKLQIHWSSITKFQQDRIAIPYWWNSTKNDIEPLPHYDCYAFGAGAMRTTITDLSQFLIAHMHEGTINSTKILEKETIELMHDHIHSSIGNGYGFGWSKDNNPRWTGHNGGMPGTRTQMWYTEPDRDIPYPIGVIVFGNQGAVAGDAITAIRDKLFEIALETASTENTAINTPGFSVVNVICIITVIAVIMIKKKKF